MTSHKESGFAPTSWGLTGRRRPGRAVPGILDGTVLLAVWVALWTVFVLGIVEPAARLGGATPRAERVERSRA